MSTQLVVTPKPEYGAILIEVTGAPAGSLEITRTDNSGSAIVRLQENQEPISGALTIFDHEAALTGPVTYSLIGERTNHVTNPGFEVNTSGWTLFGTGATLTRDTTIVWNGVASGKVTLGTGAATLAMETPSAVAVTPGEVWQIAATLRGVTGLYDLRVLNQDAVAIYNGSDNTGIDTWRFHNATFVIPEGTTTIRAAFQLMSGGPLYVDRVLFERNATYDGYIEGTVSGVAFTTVTTLDVAKPILNVPVLANLRQELVGVRDYDSDEDSSTTIHHVQDREDPIVIPGPLRTRQGLLTVYAPDYATTRSIANLAKSGEVLLFRQPTHPGMDMYLVPRTVRTRKGDRLSSGWAFDVDIAYTEVKSPSAPQQASTWNYGEVKAIGTYAQVEAAFPTYRDLVAGP